MPKLPSIQPDVLDDRALTIYVDGSMYESPRSGGRGVLFVWTNDAGAEETWDPGLPSTPGATNNEMELEAPIDALRLLRRGAVPVDMTRFNKVVIRTDSMYVYENVPRAISIWRKTGWTTKAGAAILHTPMWRRLITQMKGVNDQCRLLVHFEWAEGKKGRHAKTVDKLAKQSAKSASFGRGRPNLVRRKLSTQRVDRGSVKVAGQTIAVHVVVARYLPAPHRRFLYKYEVVEAGSPFHLNVDWAESDLNLKQGHTYVVRMNDVQDNPRFEELVAEVEEDLSPYVDALGALGGRATVREIADALSTVTGSAVRAEAVRRRLDRLFAEGQIARQTLSSRGRPYLYELTSPARTTDDRQSHDDRGSVASDAQQPA